MSTKFRRLCFVIFLAHVVPTGAQKKPVTVTDCVSAKKIVQGIGREGRISPNSRQVAYILHAPNRITNQNDYQLRVRDLDQTSHVENGSLILQSTDLLSGLTWLA